MISIFLKWYSGLVGQNFINTFSTYIIKKYKKSINLDIGTDIVIHLAGKAHEFKKISNSVEYYQVSTELTKKVFDTFLKSQARVLVSLSSVKAVAEDVNGVLS